MSDRTHQAKGDRIQQLQQQIEVRQALLENRLTVNELLSLQSAITFSEPFLMQAN
jgi:hypothetical protein